MDSLAGYTSDEEPETEETQYPSEQEQELPAFDNFVSYSENYSMKRKNLFSSFVYLPWKPEIRTRKLVQQWYDETMQKLYKEIPGLKGRYNFYSTMQNKVELFGRFGLTQKSQVNIPHVTLFPNIYGDAPTLKQLGKLLRKELRNVEPPSQLVASSNSSVDAILSNPKKKISLRLEAEPLTFLSSRTDNVFIVVKVVSDVDGQPSPEKVYLRSLMRTIQEQVESLGLEYSWATLGDNVAYHEDGLPEMVYHATIAMGELKVFDKAMDSADLKAVKKVISSSSFNGRLTFEADTIVNRSNAKILNEYTIWQNNS
ncbi:hypothetical protein FT663_02729 [Candidozyma haemuli var. vulneris]|uniref:U6 snRNA phosphodiesterase n=1 Tax=Candidozyma haemuli TaxID=45357 RepID=A0A2V1ANI7_9ASCO|nr:hypothetical protein CXQ85_001432 [[Candida] haemuloni]KAF3989636.1 hypothetical protein FT662_02715 [[Candida] haemuloni var. vulneris]KAF3991431.1 hypothetical protein FT663_02729 [[Candida] haemuloni var. vulneris]PVH19136.1 hypothetical protein CXQ85_001432 [[Candida] haemuloni]